MSQVLKFPVDPCLLIVTFINPLMKLSWCLYSSQYFFAGINSYVIAFTALAAGTSWPDLVASKIAAERQITADSAIANITCRYLF